MPETVNIRQERIERLLRELEYEVSRGIMECEIDETLSFEAWIPSSRTYLHGCVQILFRTRAHPRYPYMMNPEEHSKLRVVKP